jgi:ribonucleoside-diphosphate reductase alpha chain
MGLDQIRYVPSESAMRVLIKGNIIAPGETPQEMFVRVVETMFGVEAGLGIAPADTQAAKEEFAGYMARKLYTPGTPTLTNAGRPGYEHAALSSCAIIPADLNRKGEAERMILSYYRQNMGSGFDLTPYEHPVDLLIWLNDMAARETKSGRYDRYIGNMANLHIRHPEIRKFLRIKRDRSLPHFNCSVVVDNAFMDAAAASKPYRPDDGTTIDAAALLRELSENAWKIGDPSTINLERMNADNPIADLMPYTSAPPCAEMGLSVGETCQFVYVNISRFCTPSGIDYGLLERAIRVVTRALDDAVEYGIARYPHPQSAEVARLKRKIGIAVSGIADTLLTYDLPYASGAARTLVRDVVSFVNYVSKLESVELARRRGPCGAMGHKSQNRYYGGYLKQRYGFSTATVSAGDWARLSDTIAETGMLRNILTVIQPPAARVSLLMDASFGIEPIFGFPDSADRMPLSVADFVRRHGGDRADAILSQAAADGTFARTALSAAARTCLKTATELTPEDHIAMVAALVGSDGVIDETASKTVNLPRDATVDDVYRIFLLAHERGLKNISVYRDGSYEDQPYRLAK